ncbi:rhomboid family protease [Schizosaccharomyces cryophilus OY26]|uniref:Rhomboid family protease n=1 Tax=Schizosaccharomyces cryophilus (strain OY26 / ATCC MYA-4695 / CBS 11777 / NBRC 106824 / NRRL Y48691) TaxID=653667 RepID=S9XJF0_SCHCR|nr:rhomboid family protease [Schizosaccharomyces cryophilus OY26]EPY53811.1 rhomboid family protease [Schizosaccharomyces cryophilus OY26]
MNLLMKSFAVRECPKRKILSSYLTSPLKIFSYDQKIQNFSVNKCAYSHICKPPLTKYVTCSLKQKCYRLVGFATKPNSLTVGLPTSIKILSIRRCFSSSHKNRLQKPKTPFLLPPPSEHRSSPHVATVTAILICLINFFFFWHWDLARNEIRSLQDFQRFNWMLKHTQCSLQNLYEGRWWTLVTSLFSHQDLTHLLVNCIAIYSFMTVIVYRFGILRSLSTYFLSGVMGNFVVLERLLRKDDAVTLKGPLHVWDILFRKDNLFETQSCLKNMRSKLTLSSYATKKGVEMLPLSWRKGVLGASGSVYGIMALFACTYPFAQFVLFFVIPARASTILPLDFFVESLLITLNYDDKTQIAFDAHVTGILLGTLSSFLLIPKVWRARFMYKNSL